MWNNIELSDLIGKTFSSVKEYSRLIEFKVSDYEIYNMYHNQDCCESVDIESIVGNLDDLVGSPLMFIDVDNDEPEDEKNRNFNESHTWTTYHLKTANGRVYIRWLGESNGYYSEGVSFERATN